jgi:hypothetical protein
MKVRLYLVLAGCGMVILAGCGKRVTSVEAQEQAAEAQQGASAEQISKGAAPKSAPSDASGPFRFPRDSGGKLLAELLPTPERLPPFEKLSSLEPRSFAVPDKIGKPEVDLLPNEGSLPRAAAGPDSRPVQPRLLADDAPLTRNSFDLAAPDQAYLPARTGVRVPSPDVNKTLDVPILAQEVPDRASLDDPTTEASTALSLAAVMPQRATQAPFQRVNLPDPFENSQAVKLRQFPDEDKAPPGIAPAPPVK